VLECRRDLFTANGQWSVIDIYISCGSHPIWVRTRGRVYQAPPRDGRLCRPYRRPRLRGHRAAVLHDWRALNPTWRSWRHERSGAGWRSRRGASWATSALRERSTALWRSERRRIYRSPKYQAWRNAGWELARSARAPSRGRSRSCRKHDLDNVATKAVLDLLVTHQVISVDVVRKSPPPGELDRAWAAASGGGERGGPV